MLQPKEQDFPVHTNKGFTLLELLIVIVILGVLAAVALPNLLGQTQKARSTEATAVLDSMRTGQQTYWNSEGSFVAVGNVRSGNCYPEVRAGASRGIVATPATASDLRTLLGVNIAGSQDARWVFSTRPSTVQVNGSYPYLKMAAEGRGALYAGMGVYYDASQEGRFAIDNDIDNTNAPTC